MKTDLFQSCGHCWVFQICWHIECSTFTASSFRIWKSSTGMPSPPLALFVVMLSKVHLTSHSKMSGSRLVITSSWLSGSWRSFLYSSSVYSYHLFLISSASVWLCLNDGDFPNHLDVFRADNCYEQNCCIRYLTVCGFVLYCSFCFDPILTGKPVRIRQRSLSYISGQLKDSSQVA